MARRPVPSSALHAPAPPSDDIAALLTMADLGQTALATQGLIRLLTARLDDPAALLAARLLTHIPAEPLPDDNDTRTVLAASVARLTALIEQQDAQIAALLAMAGE